MISEPNNTHQKHVKLTKPDLGLFGRNELAILGTPCGQIKKLAHALTEILSANHQITYVDADHASAREASAIDPRSALAHKASLEATDKIDFQRFDLLDHPNEYNQKGFYYDQDIVLVNGNHFLAQSQIAVIDPKKPLDRKLAKLTDIKLFLLQSTAEGIPDFIKDHDPDWAAIPVLRIDQCQEIAEFIGSWHEQRRPKVKGLVLAGGKSQRMQQDKGLLDYHGQAQRDHLYEQLKPFCSETYISCRQEQQVDLEEQQEAVVDRFLGLGPFGALLSAFMSDPNAAWLAVACDLPFLTDQSLQFLVDHRDTSKVATTFKSPFDEFPEPLITIWEPRAYPKLLHFLGLGYSCPRKVLINSNAKILDPPQANELKNINHPEEYKQALKQIQEQRKQSTV